MSVFNPTAPLFIFQWLFDEAQMKADNVGAPVTPQQWNYIHEMGGALRSSLDNVTAVFAPSCIGHAVLSKRDWVNIKIDEISLPAALRCWEHSTRLRRKRHNNKLKRSTEPSVTNAHGESHQVRNRPRNNHRHRDANKRRENKANNSNSHIKINQNPNRPRLTKEEREERRKRRHENRQRRLEKQRKRRRHHRTNERNLTVTGIENDVASHQATITKERRNNNRRNRKNNDSADRKHGHDHKKRLQQLTPEQNVQSEQPSDQPKKLANAGNQRPNHTPNVPVKCALRLLERCSWPQCNHSCPSLTNPLTGEEMRFLELLTSFGLDIEAVAAALGVDMHTLDNMDRTELVNLLTQQVS